VYFLAVCIGKVGHNFVGETEWGRKIIIGTFALCDKRLVKLTPVLPDSFLFRTKVDQMR
jgi:hypothetical protein